MSPPTYLNTLAAPLPSMHAYERARVLQRLAAVQEHPKADPRHASICSPPSSCCIAFRWSAIIETNGCVRFPHSLVSWPHDRRQRVAATVAAMVSASVARGAPLIGRGGTPPTSHTAAAARGASGWVGRMVAFWEI